MSEPEKDWIDSTIEALPAFLTMDEAAKVLRLSKRTIARLVADGRLGSVRHGESGGARRLIPRQAVDAYLRSLEPTSGRKAG